MKNSSWEDCLDSNSSIKITPNIQKAKSLIEVAEDRIKILNLNLNKDTANYIFEDYYSSILELMQALVLLKGYKVDNHVCLGFFLRDVLNDESLFRLFDNCRFKRNSLVYYGKRMDFETARDAIKKSKILMGKLKEIIGKFDFIKLK